MLFIYSSSYGIKIISSFRLSEYEKVYFLNFLRIQLIGLIDTLLYLALRYSLPINLWKHIWDSVPGVPQRWFSVGYFVISEDITNSFRDFS